jgi:hypothetical protein
MVFALIDFKFRVFSLAKKPERHFHSLATLVGSADFSIIHKEILAQVIVF